MKIEPEPQITREQQLKDIKALDERYGIGYSDSEIEEAADSPTNVRPRRGTPKSDSSQETTPR
jgi:hypothetical protein